MLKGGGGSGKSIFAGQMCIRDRDGETEVGRVLPREYLFFTGDGEHNHFRTEWDGGQVWDWSLQSPYEE